MTMRTPGFTGGNILLSGQFAAGDLFRSDLERAQAREHLYGRAFEYQGAEGSRLEETLG